MYLYDLVREHMKREPNIGDDQSEWIMWNDDLKLINNAIEAAEDDERLRQLYGEYKL